MCRAFIAAVLISLPLLGQSPKPCQNVNNTATAGQVLSALIAGNTPPCRWITAVPPFSAVGNAAPTLVTTTISDNPLTSGATTINVNNTTGLTAPGILLLAPGTSGEYVSYSGLTATSFTGVTRGIYAGNSGIARSHASGSVVMAVIFMVAHSTTDGPDLVVLRSNSIFGSSQNYTKISSGEAPSSTTFDTAGTNEFMMVGSASRLKAHELDLTGATSIVTNDGSPMSVGPTGANSLTLTQRIITALPTSCSGLVTGTLWNNSSVVSICP